MKGRMLDIAENVSYLAIGIAIAVLGYRMFEAVWVVTR
jgi:hypothetical protein